MALPGLWKTWIFKSTYASAGSDIVVQAQYLLYAVKQQLVLNCGWTVWGSCNSYDVFGNGDGVDRWTSSSYVRWGYDVGYDHSWMVLGHPTLGWFLLDCVGTTACYSMIICHSKLGFGSVNGGTNGTGEYAPTALDQVFLINKEYWGCVGLQSYVKQFVYVMQSTDAKCTRIIFSSQGGGWGGMWSFEKAQATDPTWTDTTILLVHGRPLTPENLYTYTAPWGWVGGNPVRFRFGSLTKGSSTTSNLMDTKSAINDAQGWPFYEIPLYCTAPGIAGYKGVMTDMWWGSSARRAGDCYPDNGSNQFTTFGRLIVPWNGTEPIIGAGNYT